MVRTADPTDLRYVDALFSDSTRELWAWKAAVIERLARLRLVIHDTRTQVLPASAGIPFGFVIYPTHRLVKARKVRHTHHRMRARLAAYLSGKISFAELDAGVRGWIAHVGHADNWGLRTRVLGSLVIRHCLLYLAHVQAGEPCRAADDLAQAVVADGRQGPRPGEPVAQQAIRKCRSRPLHPACSRIRLAIRRRERARCASSRSSPCSSSHLN